MEPRSWRQPNQHLTAHTQHKAEGPSFAPNLAAFWSGKELRMTAIQRSGLYFLDQGENSTLSSAALAAYSISDPRLQIWRNRFAHLSEQGIRQLMDMSTGIKPIQQACLCK